MSAHVLSIDETSRRCRWLRQGRRRVVLTNGCFDLLHVGHIRYLREARGLGDALVVAVNSDDSVRELKGPGRPIIPEAERAEVMASLACVDFVTIFPDPTAADLVAELRPDIYVKGGDYGHESDIPEALAVVRYGGVAVFPEFQDGASTTRIIETILALGPEGLLAGRSAVPDLREVAG